MNIELSKGDAITVRGFNAHMVRFSIFSRNKVLVRFMDGSMEWIKSWELTQRYE